MQSKSSNDGMSNEIAPTARSGFPSERITTRIVQHFERRCHDRQTSLLIALPPNIRNRRLQHVIRRLRPGLRLLGMARVVSCK